MRLLYSFAIHCYQLSIKTAALFNSKAKQWVKGREKLFLKMEFEVEDGEDRYIWFHCASLGEFEQGRPVIEKMKSIYPEKKILLTFFSPSGYENKKNYDGADYIFYLPIDSPANARKFIEIWNPEIAVFVKYEFWYNYINELYKRKIPLIFISSIFRKNQHFFKFYGSWFRKHLKKVTYFFVQNKESVDYLNKIGVRNVIVSGDTRFDRVSSISANPQSFPDVESFIQGSIIFIAGSTWPVDNEVLVPLINKNHKGIKYIIVPHEIDLDKIAQLEKEIAGKTVKLSDEDKSVFPDAQVLIIDRIGMLSHLYQYASVAYIGGGFGKGVHNILEAAAFGMPIFFGPKYTKFAEARELIKYKGAFSISTKEELLEHTYAVLSNYEVLKNVSEITKEYVRLKKGATEKIITFIQAMVDSSKDLVRKMQKEINLN